MGELNRTMGEEAKLSYRVMGCILITGSKQKTVRIYVVFPSHKTRRGTGKWNNWKE